MSIQEKVARAIAEAKTPKGRELRGDDLAHQTAYCGVEAAAAITAFLEATATIPDKGGRTWRMVPEQLTPELRSAGVAWCGNPKTYFAMLDASPEFELDK